MCKLLAVNNLQKVKVTRELLANIAEILGQGQKDGLGFALTGKDKTVFHRSENTDHSVSIIGDRFYRGNIPTYYKSEADEHDYETNILYLDEKGNQQLLMHSRTSTNAITLDATHPFKIKSKGKNNYFAHNGVITIPTTHTYPVKSVNDSEYLAHACLDKGITALENYNGYAATINLSIGDKFLEIFRDDMADLHMAFSKKLDTHIFSTVEMDVILIGNLLSDDFTQPELIQDNTFLTIDVNNKIKLFDVKREKYSMTDCGSEYDSTLMQKSLGKDIDDITPKTGTHAKQYDDAFTDGYWDGYNNEALDQSAYAKEEYWLAMGYEEGYWEGHDAFENQIRRDSMG